MAERPSPTGPERAALVEDLHLAGREISAAAVLFHTAVAARRGLSATEEKALDVLLRSGPLTHAQLGERTGLAPASVTGLIDRLEGKGFASRAPHPHDGRRVLVAADERRAYEAMAPLFADWVGELERLYEEFTDDELRVVARFMHAAAERQLAATERLGDVPDRR